jgi:YVTN family beta-propeller protein
MPSRIPLKRGPKWTAGLLRACLAAAIACLAGCRAPAAGPRAGAAATPATLAVSVSATAVAVDAGGATLAAVNPDSASVTLLDLPSLGLRAEVRVGADPRTLSFTPDGARLLVANYGGDSVSIISVASGQVLAEVVVGGRPYGVVAGSDQAYVSLMGLPQIVVIDLSRLSVAARVPVGAFPAGLALSRDQANLYVTHLYSSTVTILDTASASLRQTITGNPHGNLSQFVTLSPDGTRAYLPRSYSLADSQNLTYSTTVQPTLDVLDLSGSNGSASLNLARLGGPASLPFAAAVGADDSRLYVANAGSDDISVIDLDSGVQLARMPAGRNPRGLALSPNGRRLFVDNVLDGTLDVFDTQSLARVETITLTRLALAPEVLAGKRLFNSALPPMSRDHWLACAACHLDGGADGRTWAGFPDGPRNTPALFGAATTLPLHWNGDLAELQDTEQTIRTIQGGAGLVPDRATDLDALAAYLKTLSVAASPYATDTAAAGSIRRGAYAFQRWGCAGCHAAPLYTDQHLHASNVGDPALERRQSGPLPRFDTPSLLGVWATAPYFHDGSALTLRDTLFSAGFHKLGPAMDDREIDDLVAYLQALP